MKNFTTKQMIIIALMIAVEIVLTRFLSIQLPTIRIGFGFLPIAVVAMLYGPVWAGIAAVLGDIIGVTFFSPFGIFPGFTLTALLIGVVYGIFLYKHPKSLHRTCFAVLIVTIVLQLLLDTYWLQIMTGQGFIAMLPPRVIRTIIMIPIQIILIQVIARVIIQVGGKHVNFGN